MSTWVRIACGIIIFLGSSLERTGMCFQLNIINYLTLKQLGKLPNFKTVRNVSIELLAMICVNVKYKCQVRGVDTNVYSHACFCKINIIILRTGKSFGSITCFGEITVSVLLKLFINGNEIGSPLTPTSAWAEL